MKRADLGGLIPAAAVLIALMAIRFADTPAAILPYSVLMVFLVLLSWIDLRTHRLPREIIRVGIVVGGVGLTAAALVIDEPERIWMMVLGAGLALGIMWSIAKASRGQLGDGDVRLAPLLGLQLGWLNPGIVVPGLFFGFVLGAVVAVVLLVTGHADRRSSVPFGPFLAAGTVLAILVGQPFIDLVLAR